MEEVRIDKFLWAVRLYKTRSIATEAVKTGRVLLNNKEVKPSATVKVGDTVKVKVNPIFKAFKIKELLKNRVGAKLVQDYILDVTPPEDVELYQMVLEANRMNRAKGLGRPTKKDRRDMDSFFDDDGLYWDNENEDD